MIYLVVSQVAPKVSLGGQRGLKYAQSRNFDGPD